LKKYSSIEKLNEAEAGFTTIKVGDTYTSKKGMKMTIKEIFINAESLAPDAYVSYSFETQDGQTGEETNRFTVVVDMLRNS